MVTVGYPFPEESMLGNTHVDPVSDMEQSLPQKTTWKGRIWDTFDRPPLERKLLFKVDAAILTFASLGYFLKNLDQTNINSAFLSGMKEDLGMTANQLVTATSIWTVGRIEPRWVIPAVSHLRSTLSFPSSPCTWVKA